MSEPVMQLFQFRVKQFILPLLPLAGTWVAKKDPATEGADGVYAAKAVNLPMGSRGRLRGISS